VRERRPLIHCITNYVTVNDCANTLLSFGASPAMIPAWGEAYDFARISGALYINLGTFDRDSETAALNASLGAREAGRPIVVDPVGCAALSGRAAIVERLHRTAGIDIIKGNMGEIMALAGTAAAGVKGVDSSAEVSGIEDAVLSLAAKYGCVVAATGKVDVASDGKRLARISNGTELLTRITGAGCMAGALCAATAACAEGGMFAAAVAGIAALGMAGELAAEKASLPGSFRVALIDSIYGITGDTLRQKGRVQC
jgi:hydroxyethylthiazole kinase